MLKLLFIALFVALFGGIGPTGAWALSAGQAPVSMGAGQPPAAGNTNATNAKAVDGGYKKFEYHKQSQAAQRIPSPTLVIIAYCLLWAVVLGYILLLSRRQKQLREELAALRKRINEATQATGGTERPTEGGS